MPRLGDASLAADFTAFRAPSLNLASVGGFLVLVLRGSCLAMSDLAKACVPELDHFRAPLADSERKRRRPQGLTARRVYPFVLDELRFHMTLIRRLDEDLRARIAGLLG